jgi:hypothetical protein
MPDVHDADFRVYLLSVLGDAMNRGLYRYLVITFATATALLAAVVGFNAVVDPLGMYVSGVHKPAIYNRVRLLKAYETRRVQPESIVLGTSRVHLGISPNHPGWKNRYQRRYNLAFDGATTKEMYAYLKHADAVGNLRHVMLGLDTYHLTASPASLRPDFDLSILMDERQVLNPVRMLLADLKLLSSYSTMKESIHLLQTDRRQPVWYAPNGQRLGEVYFRRPAENFVTCGPRCYFDEIDKLEVSFKLDWKVPQKKVPTIQSGPPAGQDPITSLGYIEKIIEYCRSNDIELVVFLTPAHVHQLELDAATGNWWSVENGKRKILELLARDARKHNNKDAIALYDFANYNRVTMEPLPARGSHFEMRYYWDSSHFKEVVGDMVLERLLQTGIQAQSQADDFGIKLDAGNIDDMITRLRSRQQEYRRHNASEIAALNNWVADFERKYLAHDGE